MADLFVLTKPFLEIATRSSIVYLVLVTLMRIIPKRNVGTISPNDMLALIVIGGMGTDAILGGSESIGDIALMIGIFLGWGYLFDLLEYRFPVVRSLLRHRSTLLIDQGRMVRTNMRREMVTEEELMAVLRREGVPDVSSVQRACLEADGEISVVAKRKDEGR